MPNLGVSALTSAASCFSPAEPAHLTPRRMGATFELNAAEPEALMNDESKWKHAGVSVVHAHAPDIDDPQMRASSSPVVRTDAPDIDAPQRRANQVAAITFARIGRPARLGLWLVLAAVGCASRAPTPAVERDAGTGTGGRSAGGSGGEAGKSQRGGAAAPGGGTGGVTGGAGGMSGKASSQAGAGDTADAGPDHDQRSAKRGVAYDFCKGFGAKGQSDLDLLAMGGAAGSGISWYYNWGAHAGACLTPDEAAEYVPMVWGLTDGGNACASGGVCFNDGLSIASLTADMPASAKYLLGFNEPNFAHQSNLTPTTAARAWQYLEQVAKQHKLSLVAPATNYCDTNPDKDHAGSCTAEPAERTFHFDSYDETVPAGHRYNAFEWAELFYDECSAQGAAGKDCQIDYQAGHVYSYWGLDWYVETFKRKAGLSKVDEAHCKNGTEDADEFGVDCGGNACTACSAWARAQFAKALWLTEFAPATDDGPSPRPSPDQLTQHAKDYIESELPKLERDNFVFRYAWFMPRTDIASLDHVDLLTASMPAQLTAAGKAYLDQPH